MIHRHFVPSYSSAIAIVMLMLLSTGFLIQQELTVTRFVVEVKVASAKFPSEATTESSSGSIHPETTHLSKIFSKPPPEQYMRACLVVRGANHLLYEWIAYHYTVLPLRHLIIGYDDTNTTKMDAEDDPMTSVLDRWNDTNLTYDVWRATDFAQNISYTSTVPYYQHLQRQHLFYARCMQYLQRQVHVGWVALTDIDEYIQLNPLDQHQLDVFYNESAPIMKSDDLQHGSLFLAPNETLWDRIQTRKLLRHRLRLDNLSPTPSKPENTSRDEHNASRYIPTVVEFVDEYAAKHGGTNSSPCHSIVRRRYSAVVEHFSNLSSIICVPKLAPDITDALNISSLVTVQFLHHVPPQNFDYNWWAKVLVDLRCVSYQGIERIIDRNNPHQPLDECADAYIPDAISIVRANHYIHYSDIHVSRRGTNHMGNASTELEKWDEVAHARDYQSCDHMHGWLNDFVQEFGLDKVKYLLGFHPSHDHPKQ